MSKLVYDAYKFFRQDGHIAIAFVSNNSRTTLVAEYKLNGCLEQGDKEEALKIAETELSQSSTALSKLADTLSSVLAIPFIYYSLCVVKSIPLTLAVIYNVLKDILLGAIPFCIGDIIDFFHRSYLENLRLITGYINDDKEIIKTVNQKAFKTAILIALVCWLIYLVISWAISLGHWIASLF